MPIETERLQPHHADSILAHLCNSRDMVLSSKQLEEYVQWRYFSRGETNSIIALNKGECLAFIDSQFRDYNYSGGQLQVQESSEWYCSPKYRPVGLGLSVLKKLMDHEAPILSVRGTEASQKLVLKLNWRKLKPTTLFSKMNNAKTKLVDLAVDFSSRSRGEFSSLKLVLGQPGESALRSLASAPSAALRPQLAPWELTWFSTAPEVLGRFIWSHFELDKRFMGYALARVYEGKDYRRAQIVHAECVNDNAALFTKMIRLLTDHLMKEGAIRIMSRGSSDKFAHAMRKSGFQASVPPQPVFWWDKTTSRLENDATELTNLRGDDSIRPLSAMS